MIEQQKMVEEFHKKFGSRYNSKPTLTDVETRFLRARLVVEEAAEFMEACNTADMELISDSLCDLLVVAFGSAVAFGIDLESLFAEVHRSNMTKSGGGQDTGGKIMKGPDFEPPDLLPILKEQGWKEYGTCVCCGTFLVPQNHGNLCDECLLKEKK